MPIDPQKVLALIVVDVQPTFTEGGELAVEGGNDVAQRIADYVAATHGRYETIITTQDWHIEPGAHFSDTPDYVDTWPRHGVAGTPNAELHPALANINAGVHIKKGQFEAAYSGFDGTDERDHPLNDVLQEFGVTDLDICGIAESHCVKETALDAIQNGYRTRVLTDLTVPVSPDQGEKAREAMARAGVELVNSADINDPY